MSQELELSPEQMTISVDGLGMIMYSPCFAAAIQEGEDYFTDHYTNAEDVQRHIQSGSIVGFGTGSPGTYRLIFRSGYPENHEISKTRFALRLGIKVEDGGLCIRDVLDLSEWSAACPADQALSISNGMYHMTLLSDVPESGMLGDGQVIRVFFKRLASFPALALTGIPTLCR
jgi:hypothetical protein